SDGNLPDIEELAFRLRMSEADLMVLLPKLSHWIEGDWDALISPRYHDDTPGDIKPIPIARSRETETEEETETEVEEETEAAQARPSPRRRVQQASKPDDVPGDVWEAFLSVRKARRAPLTPLALN